MKRPQRPAVALTVSGQPGKWISTPVNSYIQHHSLFHPTPSSPSAATPASKLIRTSGPVLSLPPPYLARRKKTTLRLSVTPTTSTTGESARLGDNGAFMMPCSFSEHWQPALPPPEEPEDAGGHILALLCTYAPSCPCNSPSVTEFSWPTRVSFGCFVFSLRAPTLNLRQGPLEQHFSSSTRSKNVFAE
ncbi:hypothetical protein BC567DRAFT_221336 [Phyllosticta citribraziliensis]